MNTAYQDAIIAFIVARGNVEIAKAKKKDAAAQSPESASFESWNERQIARHEAAKAAS